MWAEHRGATQSAQAIIGMNVELTGVADRCQRQAISNQRLSWSYFASTAEL
jgi:hypothetical protein